MSWVGGLPLLSFLEVVGLIQRNTDKGRCTLDNPSEMLTKAYLLLLMLSIVQYWCNGCVIMLKLGCWV